MKTARQHFHQKLTLANYGIFIQSLAAMLGSLYYSSFGDPVQNVMDGRFFPSQGGFTPCELCWYARILMYPIVPLSVIALLTEDRKFVKYILPLSIPGILLGIYHYGLQKWNFPNAFQCTAANPCSALQVDYFGVVTIPFLALVAFTVITVLGVWQVILERKLRHTADEVSE